MVVWNRISIIVFTFISFNTQALETGFDIEVAKNRCGLQTTTEKPLYSSDFKWWYDLPEMAQRFDEIYNSGKRLPLRASYNKQSKQFQLFYDGSGGIKPLKITEEFILSVTKHVENALDKKYAEFVFFPDMGHSHLYIPTDHWKKVFEPTPPVTDFNLLYQQMLADPKLEVLYHTAEQLRLTDENKVPLLDKHLNYRYWNRNPMGGNRGGDHLKMPLKKDGYNTVGELDGYQRWGGGFEINSSKDGCFPYLHKGKVHYFDLSLKPLAYDPSSFSGDDVGY